MCKGKSCLAPEPCKNLAADHSEYTELLQRMRKIPGIKKVFVRSGIRYDYMLQDRNKDFFKEPFLIGVHPNDNTATVWLNVNDLADIIKKHGNEVIVTEISNA